MSKQPIRDSVPLSKIFLDLKNPRFVPVKDENSAIQHLCKEEKVFELAKDIVEKGLNPMELTGLLQLDGKENKDTYVVSEGNRRICALKLLSDTDLAPPNLRSSFEKLARSYTRILTVESVIFKTEEDVRPWLERMHEGEKGGVGRKSWDATQKTRFSGKGPNAAAHALLTQAEKLKWITEEDRKKVLTTVQRFVSNAAFKEHFGLDVTDPQAPRTTRTEEEFNLVMKQFVTDAVSELHKPAKERKVNSRMNKDEIAAYARKVVEEKNVSSDRVPPIPITMTASVKPSKGKRRLKPKIPVEPNALFYDRDIADLLLSLGNTKLERLYYSLCQIELGLHPVLISVGIWSFVECLTAAAGRESTPFSHYLSSNLLSYGVDKARKRVVTDAIQRVEGRGNESKHHPFSGSYDKMQIHNDWMLMQQIFVKLIENAISQK